jgi:hypothetical protein
MTIRYIDDKDAFVYGGVGPKTLTAVCYGVEMCLVHKNEGLVLAYLLADCDQLSSILKWMGLGILNSLQRAFKGRENIGGPLPYLTLTSLFCSRKEFGYL